MLDYQGASQAKLRSLQSSTNGVHGIRAHMEITLEAGLLVPRQPGARSSARGLVALPL